MFFRDLTCALAGACVAVPVLHAATVSGVALEQDPATGAVSVTYTLDEPAIVTVDVRTNRGDDVWVTVGADKLKRIYGEANKLVTAVNTPVTAGWRLDDAFPATLIPSAKAVVTAWSVTAPPPYMAINLTDPDVVRYYVSEKALPYPASHSLYKTEWLLMRRIPAAGVKWRMGAGENVRTVTLTEDYYIGVFEVTIGQWLRCGLEKANLTTYTLANALRPANQLKYNFLRGSPDDGINWPETGHRVKETSPLGVLRGKIGIEVDLPTEAQWEFACRAGTYSETYDGGVASEAFASANGWYGLSAWTDISEVGHFAPNPWGLYDMYGSMLEWCLDWWNASPDADDTENPMGMASSSNGTRIQRSCGWNEAYSHMVTDYFPKGKPDNAYLTYGVRLVAPCRAPAKDK